MVSRSANVVEDAVCEIARLRRRADAIYEKANKRPRGFGLSREEREEATERYGMADLLERLANEIVGEDERVGRDG